MDRKIMDKATRVCRYTGVAADLPARDQLGTDPCLDWASIEANWLSQ
jgi:hypothetical protein